jgi:hypothetical protein
MNADDTKEGMTYRDLFHDPGERLLLAMAMNYFYTQYLPKLRDEIVIMLGRQDFYVQARRFNLGAYMAARAWLVNHKALAGCLELRKGYPPGWLTRF